MITISLFLILTALLGRVTEWEHFPHYGGGNEIIAHEDILVSATSGGVLFAHFSVEEEELVADSGWTSPGKLSYDRVSHVIYDDSDNLWVSMNGGGIDVFSPTGEKSHFNQIDGLPLNLGINETLPDSFVYAATTQGLCIREFSFFDTYTSLNTGGGLPSDNVTCLTSSDAGLYVGTTSGLVFLGQSADPAQTSAWEMQSIDPVSIIDFEWQNDTLWVATAAGLFRKPSALPWEEEILFPGDQIYSMTYGPQGLAVGCTNAGYIFSDGNWTVYEDNLSGNALTGLVWFQDKLCGVLANTYAFNRLSGAGLALLLEDGTWRRTFPEFGPVSNDIRDCTILPDGSVWGATNRAGASVYVDGNWPQVSYHLTNINQCFAICPADDGLFISSQGYGIDWLKWQDGEVQRTVHFDSNDGLINNRIYCAEYGDANTTWFGHRSLEEVEESGITRLTWSAGDTTTTTFTTITGADGLPSKEVNAILPMGERYCWAGTDAGLAFVDGTWGSVLETYTTSDGLPSSLVTSLAKDRSGVIYIGTASGLAYIENDVINEIASISSGINAMACDDFGSVWLATGDGLKRYFRATGEIEEYTAFNSSLLEGLTNSFAIDNEQGYIWLATDHGFWRGKLESSLSGDGSEVRIYPNPFIPATGDVLGIAGIADIPTDVSIFDLQGSLVHSFSVERRSEIAWNGINSDGKLIASGIYFLQVNQADTEFELLKFTLVR